MSPVISLNKINPILRRANYVVSLFLVVVFFIVLMTHLNREVRDLDIWLHLKTGEEIALNREIPLTDPFSFTKPNQPWINHEWLFQLTAYSFYNLIGLDGLIVMQNIVFIALFFILLAMGLRNRNFLFLTTVLYLLLLNTSYRFTIRPDMFSGLFLVIFIYILKQKRRYLYLLPLLQVIWTNMHGFFFIGPIAILVFYLGEKNKRLLWIFLFSLAATLINPQLVKGAVYPLTMLWGLFKHRFAFEFIQELKNPLSLKTIFNFQSWPFYKALIFISLFSFRFNQKKFNLALFILWLLSLLFSLSALRNIFYFAIISAIAIIYNTNERVSSDKNLSLEKFSSHKFFYIGRYVIISVFVVCLAKNALLNIDCHYYDLDNYNFKSCLWGESQRNFPRKAVDFILANNLPARLFNDFNSGAYLIGRSCPPRNVFIDGRTEFYGDDFLKTYKEAANAENEAIPELIDKYDLKGFFVTLAMSNFDEKLAKYLFEDPVWKAVYFDETALIFLKDSSDNKVLIDKFYIDLKSWRAPEEKIGRIPTIPIFPYKNVRRGGVLKELGCFQAAISEAEAALKIMPNCIEAFDILGNSYLALEDYSRALENLRLAVTMAPNALELRIKLALALYKTDYLEEAELQLKKLIKARPKDSENYYSLAKVYKKMGFLDQAETMAGKACDLSGNKNIGQLKFWAELLFESKKLKQSLETYRKAQQLQPDDTQVLESIKKLEKIL